MDKEQLSRVLLVDDEPNLLDGLCRGMRKEPFELFTATSGLVAIELLSNEEIDVVVSDEQMPGMRGSEFLGHVRRRWPDTVRIMLTGQATLDDAIRAINEGEIFRFLQKPCNAIDLAQTIRQGLQIRELTQKSSQLLCKVRQQQATIENLEADHPGITHVNRRGDGAIVIEDGPCDIDELLREITAEIGG